MMPFSNRAVALVCLVLLSLVTLSCGDGGSNARRTEKAAERDRLKTGDIVFGLVASGDLRKNFLQGAEMAIEEVNRDGGLLGRSLKGLMYDDHGDASYGHRIAKTLARNEDVVAVVGHGLSDVAIPVSIVYEKEGILLISYGAMNPIFTKATGHLTFSNIITEEEIGAQIGEFFNTSGLENVSVAVLVESSDYGSYERIAESFLSYAGDLQEGTLVQMAAIRSYFGENMFEVTGRRLPKRRDFYEMLWDLKESHSFDAILIAGDLHGVAWLIREARMLGIDVPVMALGAGVTPSKVKEIAGDASRGVIVATLMDEKKEVTARFVDTFKKRFGMDPGIWAAQGYDAVSALAVAIKKAGSTVPTEISTTMRFFSKIEGVTGTYSFSTAGSPVGKKIYFKSAWDGSTVPVGDLTPAELADETAPTFGN